MKTLLAILAVLVVIGAGVLAWGLWPTATRAVPQTAFDVNDTALIEQGRYVMTASDCAACHTSDRAKPFAGGAPIATPVGVVYASNITPDPETGIGGYTLDAFDRAVRHGIRPDGRTIYPAMPYPDYAKMTDRDIAALYAFFTHGVQPVRQANRSPEVPLAPIMRFSLAYWRKAFGPDPQGEVFDPTRYADPVVARGAYLVQGPGHCGTCHTPRTPTLAEVATDDSNPAFLSGGAPVDGYVPYNLRGDKGGGLGQWTVEEVDQSLRWGRNDRGAVVGTPMQDVVYHQTQNMTPADTLAIATYLKSLPATGNGAVSYTASDDTQERLIRGETHGRGEEIFLDSCAACHLQHGHTAANTLPEMAGNPTILAQNPATLIRLVLAGDKLPSTKERPSPLGMPAFGWRFDDESTAQLLTFLREGWGNRAPAVTADAVARVRKDLAARGTQAMTAQ